jgi:hypothetical protein
MTTTDDSPEHVPGQMPLPYSITREELVSGNPERALLLEKLEELDMAALRHRAEVLADIARHAAGAKLATDELDAAVAEARGLGATWQQIADAAGMTSRQVAWKRWRRPDETEAPA